MSWKKDGHTWATAQVPQRGTGSVGILSSSWKEKKPSDLFQAVPNSMGYLEPLEDSTWSQNVDSAASMYPPPTLPLTLDPTWGEDYQDLSTWCPKLQPVMAADTKDSSYTVQDDELNTPEVGVQHDFNFTASCNVLKENTMQYLSEAWDTSLQLPSPPLYVPQKSSLEETVKKTDTGNTQSVTTNEFFIDDGCVLSVSHEEEIVTSHNVEGLNLEFVQTKEPDGMKESVNSCELGVAHRGKNMDIGNYRSGKYSLVVIKEETDKNTDVKMANRVANTDKVGSLGSLLVSDLYVRIEGNDVPVHTNQLQAEENLGLKNLLSGSYHSSSNDGIKSVETFGCNTVVSKVTDTELRRKCEVIRPVKTNTDMMMQTVGYEEGAGKFASVDARTHAAEVAGQKETTTSIFGTDISVKVGQRLLPVNSELTGTAEHVEILAKSLAGMSSEPHVAGIHVNEGMLGGNSGIQQQMAVKEENATDRNFKLNLSPVWEGTDNSSINVSTPDVMEYLMKQTANFDLIGYIFSNPKDFQQDLLPVSGDDRISASCTDETPKVEPIIAQIEQSPDDAEFVDSTEGNTAVEVEVVKPFCIAKSDHEQNDSMFEPMELEEEEVHCSLEHRSDQLFEEQARMNVKNDFKQNKGQWIQKVIETRNDTQPDSTLESRILKDGSDLRLKISKVKVSRGQTSSKKVVLPQEQVSPKEDASELKELPLSKRTRGRPAKRALPSTSEEKNETRPTNRSPRTKSCSLDEPWIPPSKRTRLTSGESCDRYRELRDKNNEASRKSRQNRKTKESGMKEYAAELERDNQTLQIKADEMERLVKKLREALLEAVVKAKKQ